MWKMFALNALVQHTNDLFGAFLPLYAHQIGLTASVTGIILAAFSVCSFAIRMVLPRLTELLGDTRLLAIALYVGTAGFLLVPLSPDAITLGAAAALFGFSFGCAQPLTLILMYNTAGSGRAGEAIGLRSTFNNLGRITGPAIFGWVAAVAGMLPVFWITAGLMALCGHYSRPAASVKQVTGAS